MLIRNRDSNRDKETQLRASFLDTAFFSAAGRQLPLMPAGASNNCEEVFRMTNNQHSLIHRLWDFILNPKALQLRLFFFLSSLTLKQKLHIN